MAVRKMSNQQKGAKWGEEPSVKAIMRLSISVSGRYCQWLGGGETQKVLNRGEGLSWRASTITSDKASGISSLLLSVRANIKNGEATGAVMTRKRERPW